MDLLIGDDSRSFAAEKNNPFITFKEIHSMNAACTDLVDAPYSDRLSMSRDDLKFINIVEDSAVQCADGHYSRVHCLLKETQHGDASK